MHESTSPTMARTGGRHRQRGRRRTAAARLVAVLGSLLVVSVLVLDASRGAFNATTGNGSNSWSSGSVVLSDDDAGSVMFNVTNMKPGDSATRCINVTYTGTLTADVKLYGAVGGTGLAPYLDTTVDIGSGATGGAAASCAGFASTSTLFSSTLGAFAAAHTSFANGLTGFAGATNPTTRSYRFTVSLQNNNAAQNKTATATFTWEAQNT